MSTSNTDNMRRKARLLTEDDLDVIQDLIAAITGGGGLDTPAILLKELTFGQAMGGIPAGTTFPAGTSHDRILEMLSKAPIAYPTYTAPKLSLASTALDKLEIGALMNLKFTPTWTKNDAGEVGSYMLKQGSQTLFTQSVPSAYTQPQFVLTDATVSYQASVSYAAGNIKNDSDGNPYPQGRIEAGTIFSNTISLSGIRYGFYGADTVSSIPKNSNEIRAFSGKLQGVSNGTTFTIHVPAGSRRITLWYPESVRDVSSIKYVEQGNAQYNDLFTKTFSEVEGANGYAAARYKGFTWLPAIAVNAAMTFLVDM